MKCRSRLLFPALALLMAPACFAATTATPAAPAEPKAAVPESRGIGPGGVGWKAQHEAFNKRAEAGGFDVLFIGDSITQGWAGGGKAAWDLQIAPFTAANFGIGGDRTENVLWRLQNGNLTGKLNPKVIVLMIGTNNTGARKEKPEDIAAGIAAILKTLHERFPDAKILLHDIFPRGPNPQDPLRVNNAAVNQLIAKFDGQWNVKYVAIGSKFLEPDGTLTRVIMPDLLHLSPKGYQIWADAVVPEIKAALGTP